MNIIDEIDFDRNILFLRRFMNGNRSKVKPLICQFCHGGKFDIGQKTLPLIFFAQIATVAKTTKERVRKSTGDRMAR